MSPRVLTDQVTLKSNRTHPEGFTACFSIQAVADASVMPRVLELFAKRGLIPCRWHSDLAVRSLGQAPELTIDLQVEGLERPAVDHIAHQIRAMVSVCTVLTSEKSYA